MLFLDDVYRTGKSDPCFARVQPPTAAEFSLIGKHPPRRHKASGPRADALPGVAAQQAADGASGNHALKTPVQQLDAMSWAQPTQTRFPYQH